MVAGAGRRLDVSDKTLFTMKTLNIIIKLLSVLLGLAAYQDVIPAKFAPIAVLVFACSSTLKDLCIKVGDWLDDRQLNGSFKP